MNSTTSTWVINNLVTHTTDLSFFAWPPEVDTTHVTEKKKCMYACM